MKLVSTIVFALAAAGAGAAGWGLYDRFAAERELRGQLAEKDRVIAALNGDVADLRRGLGSLSDKNAALMTLVGTSLEDTAALAKSNQSALEKVQSVIRRLAKLQADLLDAGQPPEAE